MLALAAESRGYFISNSGHRLSGGGRKLRELLESRGRALITQSSSALSRSTTVLCLERLEGNRNVICRFSDPQEGIRMIRRSTSSPMMFHDQDLPSSLFSRRGKAAG